LVVIESLCALQFSTGLHPAIQHRPWAHRPSGSQHTQTY
jgi:hypothetical protein